MNTINKILAIVLLVHSFTLFGQMDVIGDTEISDALYMLEEEKLARDVYVALGEKWDKKIFSNISSSEERHIASVRALAEKNNIIIPPSVISDSKGVFDNQDLQTLYDELIATGSQSLVAALQVGAKIEELDIKDLDMAMANTENVDLQDLYRPLKKASEKHLRAFVKNLDKQGIDYTPVILSKLQFDNIISAKNAKDKSCSGDKKNSKCKKKKGSKKKKGCCSAK